MVEIISKKPAKEAVKRINCRGCGAKLSYVPNEVQQYNGRDISGGPDGREWIICPNCGKDVTIRTW